MPLCEVMMGEETWVRFAQSGPLLDQRRQTLRLADHDYARGGIYYVTLCTHERECLFGEVQENVMHLNYYGQIVQEEWLQSAVIRPNITLDAFVVMPNHFHAVVILTPVSPHKSADQTQDDTLHRAPNSLGSLLSGFKGAVTCRINAERDTHASPIWQRNYHERIIRNDDNLHRARLYIANNPARWPQDMNNPTNLLPNAEGTTNRP